MLEIDQTLVTRMARGENASSQVRILADDLASGRVVWHSIALGGADLPPELQKLISLGARFVIPPADPAEPAVLPERSSEPEQYSSSLRRTGPVEAWVGPSDIDDENQMPESWLE